MKGWERQKLPTSRWWWCVMCYSMWQGLLEIILWVCCGRGQREMWPLNCKCAFACSPCCCTGVDSVHELSINMLLGWSQNSVCPVVLRATREHWSVRTGWRSYATDKTPSCHVFRAVQSGLDQPGLRKQLQGEESDVSLVGAGSSQVSSSSGKHCCPFIWELKIKMSSFFFHHNQHPQPWLLTTHNHQINTHYTVYSPNTSIDFTLFHTVPIVNVCCKESHTRTNVSIIRSH